MEKIKEMSTRMDEFFSVKEEATKNISPKEKQVKSLTKGKDYQR